PMKSFPPLGGFFDFTLFSNIFTFIILIYNNMKNIVFIVFALFAGLQVMAQEEPTKIVCGEPYVDKENIIRRFVQQKAEPQEGMEKFKENFIKEFDQTIISSEEKEVRFLLRFVVEKDGSF